MGRGPLRQQAGGHVVGRLGGSKQPATTGQCERQEKLVGQMWADGHVGFLVETIDLNLYQGLSTISGGEAIPAEAY